VIVGMIDIMTLDHRSPNQSPRRYSGKRVVFWMFAIIITFGVLFWLGMVLFVAPIRV
jgi:hypothetical protein